MIPNAMMMKTTTKIESTNDNMERPKREIQTFRVVANDHLCLVDIQLLKHVEDRNDHLMNMVDNLQDENLLLRYLLDQKQHLNQRLEMTVDALQFQVSTLQHHLDKAINMNKE